MAVRNRPGNVEPLPRIDHRRLVLDILSDGQQHAEELADWLAD